MDHALHTIYLRALQAIADAGGIEGDALRPIVFVPDPMRPEDCVGYALVAAALHERLRRGYAAPPRTDGGGTDGLLLQLERGHPEREQLLTSFGVQCVRRLGPGAEQPLQYLLAELTANIWDHAEIDVGFVAFGTGARTCALAVVDAGVSIPLSYVRRDIVFASDTAAVEAALEGKSARPQGGRGYGLRTSAKIVIEGWGGTLLLASRHATVLRSREGRETKDTDPLHWNGTVIAIEAPLPLPSVDLYRYVEG